MALLAIAHFRASVQEVCRTVLKQHAEALAEAVGKPRGEFTTVFYADPEKLTSSNYDWLSVGAKGKRPDGKEQLWGYVYWKRDSIEKEFRCGVGFEIWPVGQTDRERFGEAVDRAVSAPPFAADEPFWASDSKAVVSFYCDMKRVALLSSKRSWTA
jgi:hypothetical protein